MQDINKLKLEAESKWGWYEKEFFEPQELSLKKHMAIIASMVDFALKKVTDNILETLLELEEKK